MSQHQGTEYLAAIADRLSKSESVGTVTVRELLSWFGAKRRGLWVVTEIRTALGAHKLSTEPDFEGTYIDTPIRFTLAADLGSTNATVLGAAIEETAAFVTGAASSTSVAEPIDPTHRIGQLAAANNPPLFVAPTDSLSSATTSMLVRGFSQLPVMTSTREVKGVVSWQSIGARVAQGKIGATVQEMMEAPHHEIRHDASLFQAIPAIVSNDYVLVRAKDNTICGIVTASDLSVQFRQLSEPFLLLGEIENHIRQLIVERFPLSDLQVVKDQRDVNRRIDGAADLTFGEYIFLLDNPDRWAKSELLWDRRVFCDQLHQIRELRNDVMHFDPDPLSDSDLNALREFTRFLQRAFASR